MKKKAAKTLRRIEDCTPDSRNPNKGTKRGLDLLETSLEKFGAVRSIAVDRNGVTIAGAKTLQSAVDKKIPIEVVRSDGKKLIVVQRTDLDMTEPMAQAAGIADNRVAEVGLEWDAEMLTKLKGEGVGVGDFWFDEEFAKMFGGDGDAADDPGAQADKAAALQKKWKVKRGQVWEAGRHRVMCGDATSEKDVSAVMKRALADAVVTDPPYGINRKGIPNDSPDTLRALFDGVLARLPIQNGVVVAFQSPRLFWVWLDAARQASHALERLLWMYKPNDETFPWRGWLLKSEAILVTSVGKGQWQDVKPYSHDVYSPTTLGKELEGGQGWHPSVKPLSVVVDIVKRVVPARGAVVDPFLGSGTTVVAAEQLDRTCYGMEIEPKYVAVTLERLAGMGLKPKRVSG